MDDPVHVEVQVVELHPVRVGPRGVDRPGDAAGVDERLLLDDVGDRARVPIGEPPVEGGDAHGDASPVFFGPGGGPRFALASQHGERGERRERRGGRNRDGSRSGYGR